MDPNHPQAAQQQQLQQQQQQQLQPPPPPPGTQPAANQAQPNPRKRRKADANGDEAPHPAEPRRLRRSHEACARCRSKKIKCDSKHPRCTACAAAGTVCNQEDRHRQTLTPRGHTEHIERQLLQCDVLLKRFIEGFSLNNLDEILQREGIEIDTSDPTLAATFQFISQPPPQAGPSRPFPLRSEGPPPPGGSPPRGYPYHPSGQPMMPHGYPAPIPMPYPGPPYGPPPHHIAMQGPPPPGYPPHVHPIFQSPLHAHPPMESRPPSAHDIKGQDPLSHDLSSTHALVKSFGVAASIVSDLKLQPNPVDREDREDLAVGASGLSSGRDRDIPVQPPHDASKWIALSVRRSSIVSVPSSASESESSNVIPVWLPKDRNMVQHIVDVYFTRLNFHRPVFLRKDFEEVLDDLYEGGPVPHDPGFICSAYLVFALGTLSEMNHRASTVEKENQQKNNTHPISYKKLMPEGWPDHEEFFERALAVKPDLRVTVSSLQALILLQWYLYTERQGRTLWRLVGSLVRLAIELGLHHDPTSQGNIFSEEECHLRIKLWGIVLMHDRGTSILLGRPLAIAPSDANTPRPSRSKSNSSDISEHFVLSAPIAEIQADIINSLYAPTTQNASSISRHAIRISKSMVEFRRQLPEGYKLYFNGTENWSTERRAKLVQDITEDQGLTLLKIGITRILLLRALFSSKELDHHLRQNALVDAITTSHNIVVVHNQLIQFPDIAFFVSPIPLHIAAMVILYGHMSNCSPLGRQVALEDVWMALNMLPSFRWRWERKDAHGGYPLIAKVAEGVLNIDLAQVAPSVTPVLLPENDWEAIFSSKANGGQMVSPVMGPAQYLGPNSYGPEGGSAMKESPQQGAMPGSPQEKKLAPVPPGLFYPIYQHTTGPSMMPASANVNNGNYNELLASVTQPIGAYGFQQSQDSFIIEEKDTSMAPSAGFGSQMWMNGKSVPQHQAKQV